MESEPQQATKHWDTSSSDEFFEYYAQRSASPRDIARFTAARDYVLRVMQAHGVDIEALEVADIGCGAGTQSFLWSDLGHYVHGIDVNEPLIELARRRAEEKGYRVDMRVGSATDLPWDSESMDVCLLPELLEHVPNWEDCLDEAARVVKPGGFLYLTTTTSCAPCSRSSPCPATPGTRRR